MNNTEATSAATSVKPTIIGIYGLPGCGKSFGLEQIKSHPTFSNEQFAFYDGYALIADVTPGGLDHFRRLNPDEQKAIRGKVISKATSEYSINGKTAVVTGHLLLLEDESMAEPENIATAEDWKVYTHIIYLHVDADVIYRRRTCDGQRVRAETSTLHLLEWQRREGSGVARLMPAASYPVYHGMGNEDFHRGRRVGSTHSIA